MFVKKASLIGEELWEKEIFSVYKGVIDMPVFYEIMKENGYDINDYDIGMSLYMILDRMLSYPDYDIILNFGEKGFIARGVWRALMILKAEDKLNRIKIGIKPDQYDINTLKWLYGEDAVQLVEVGKVFKSSVPKLCAVYSRYYGVNIDALNAVRVYNDNIGDFDWIYPVDATDENENYYPYRCIRNQAVWIRYKGYIPKSKAVRSKWIGGWVAKDDTDYIFTGTDYIPVEDINKHFFYINGKYYRRKTLKTFCGNYDHWSYKMFRANGLEVIKGKLKALRGQYKKLSLVS
ncbi:MAG: hypothetical protein RXO36_06535 [Candidatus Nanopusillus acidilobi]